MGRPCWDEGSGRDWDASGREGGRLGREPSPIAESGSCALKETSQCGVPGVRQEEERTITSGSAVARVLLLPCWCPHRRASRSHSVRSGGVATLVLSRERCDGRVVSGAVLGG